LPSYSSAAFKTSFPAAQATAAGGKFLKKDGPKLDIREEELHMEEEDEEEEDSPPFDDIPTQTSSNRTASDSERLGYGTTTMISTASTLLMPKKLRSGRLSTLTTSSSSPKYVLLPVSVKRRKGIPHRSPCC
jgi:hypothetical protein